MSCLSHSIQAVVQSFTSLAWTEPSVRRGQHSDSSDVQRRSTELRQLRGDTTVGEARGWRGAWTRRRGSCHGSQPCGTDTPSSSSPLLCSVTSNMPHVNSFCIATRSWPHPSSNKWYKIDTYWPSRSPGKNKTTRVQSVIYSLRYTYNHNLVPKYIRIHPKIRQKVSHFRYCF